MYYKFASDIHLVRKDIFTQLRIFVHVRDFKNFYVTKHAIKQQPVVIGCWKLQKEDEHYMFTILKFHVHLCMIGMLLQNLTIVFI